MDGSHVMLKVCTLVKDGRRMIKAVATPLNLVLPLLMLNPFVFGSK